MNEQIISQQQHLHQFQEEVRGLMQEYGVLNFIPKTIALELHDKDGMPVYQVCILPGQFDYQLRADWTPVVRDTQPALADES